MTASGIGFDRRLLNRENSGAVLDRALPPLPGSTQGPTSHGYDVPSAPCSFFSDSRRSFSLFSASSLSLSSALLRSVSTSVTRTQSESISSDERGAREVAGAVWDGWFEQGCKGGWEMVMIEEQEVRFLCAQVSAQLQASQPA